MLMMTIKMTRKNQSFGHLFIPFKLNIEISEMSICRKP